MIQVEIRQLIRKEIVLEWRNRHALNGILLYLVSTIFICYLGFKARQGSLDPIVWNTVFWIIIMFSAVNAVAKSFIQVSPGRMLYLYTIASPEAIILSKVIYNSILLILLGLAGILFYSIILGNPVADIPLFLSGIILGCCGLAAILTLVSGIAAKAANSTTLMAILSFPLILPVLLVILRISGNALDGIDRLSSADDLAILFFLDLITIVSSYLLFPYLWKN